MTNRPSDLLPISRSSPVRLGAISFVNTIPVYADLQLHSDIQLIYDVPAALNRNMLALPKATVDISPVSSACYLRNRERFVLLDDLSVSSPGAVESVLFLSKVPIGPDLLDTLTISVPNDSETSIALLRWLLREETGTDLAHRFQVYEASAYQQALLETGNALVIGDNALMVQEARSRSAETRSDYYCYDLSSLWQGKTGLPFVFAVWVADRDWAEQHPEALTSINTALCEARNRFFTQPPVFEAGLKMAQERSGLPKTTLSRYYQSCLSYHLGTAHRESLERFNTIIQAGKAEEFSILARS